MAQTDDAVTEDQRQFVKLLEEFVQWARTAKAPRASSLNEFNQFLRALFAGDGGGELRIWAPYGKARDLMEIGYCGENWRRLARTA